MILVISNISGNLIGRRVDALGEGRALDVLLARAGALPAVPRVAGALLLSVQSGACGHGKGLV